MTDLNPRSLTWAEVEPAKHAFDGASAMQVVCSLEPAQRVPLRSDVATTTDAVERSHALDDWEREYGQPWVDAMSYALVEHYGRWTLGWQWGQGESDVDGGPVKSWFGTQSSIASPEETRATVAASLREWREWLENLAKWFDEYPVGRGAVDRQHAVWRRAVRDLIMHVVEATGAESGWYGHCHLVVSWFLERWGIACEVADALVGHAIGGRFESWIAPDAVLVEGVAHRLALSVEPAGGALSVEEVPDHLQRWLASREDVPWSATGRSGELRATASVDVVAAYISDFDGAIDARRADGLMAALELMRADARRGASLNFALLRTWQQHVLGVARPPLRTQPAFAKGGNERYGIAPDMRDGLDACLTQSALEVHDPLPIAARAARAFLDVCFFHPFSDGNARSAFLTALFVLARERLVLSDGGRGLRTVVFHADDAQDALWLTEYINTTITSM